MSENRAQWGSRIGFVLAAAGSAVGLGNLWKFPYITGKNGGGAFVLVYLLCIVLVGLPIMVAEIMLGRVAQTSNVGTFRKLAPRSPWVGAGWLMVVTSFLVLSYYSVVAGWAIHYVGLSLKGTFGSPATAKAMGDLFMGMFKSPGHNMLGHTLFMLMTIGIVLGGIQAGVERAGRVLMPLLFVLMGALMIYSMTLPGFGKALNFVFGFRLSSLSGKSVLEALGHSFFTLSVGMGAMLTFGSYLSKKDNIISASLAITVLDTAVALMACLVLFPITFSYGMKAAKGPGLVFINMPVAFSNMPGGTLWAVLFFLLLLFAALSSSISMLEVVAAYFIDERKWNRRVAVLVTGAAIFVAGIPSALSGGPGFFGKGMEKLIGKNWFDSFDYLASNWMLPIGGLLVAAFCSWRLDAQTRQSNFEEGSKVGKVRAVYMAWLSLLRVLAPIAIFFVMLDAIGVIELIKKQLGG